MKSKNLLIGFMCLLIVVVFLSMSTKSQKPKETPKFEIIEIATGASPHWSPDGTKLAFVYKGTLCVANADGKGEIKKIYIPKDRLWTFDWMTDSAFVVSEKRPWTPKGKGRGHKFIIETVDMNGQVQVVAEDSIPGLPDAYDFSYIGAPFVLEDGTVGYFQIYEEPNKEETKVFRVIKEGKGKTDSWKKKMKAFVKPYPWGAIWVESLDETVRKRVSKGAATWTWPELSPDGNKMSTLNHRGEIIVMDLQGNILANLGMGYPAIWSPDNKRIAFCLQEESHYDIVASELYMINVDGTGRTQITDTPDEIETGPVWSPDGTKIACGSHSSAKIFVIKLSGK
jgi:Tol biopolymer transport system component